MILLELQEFHGLHDDLKIIKCYYTMSSRHYRTIFQNIFINNFKFLILISSASHIMPLAHFFSFLKFYFSLLHFFSNNRWSSQCLQNRIHFPKIYEFKIIIIRSTHTRRFYYGRLNCLIGIT